MLSDEGVYSERIPSGTLVPHWAYIRPSDYDDTFDAGAAKLVGGQFLLIATSNPTGSCRSAILLTRTSP